MMSLTNLILVVTIGQHRQQHHHRPGRGLNLPLTISLEDVFFGETKKLRYNPEISYGTCPGSGCNAPTCHVCSG